MVAWISLEDEARAIIHLIDNEEAQGHSISLPQNPPPANSWLLLLAKNLAGQLFSRFQPGQ